MIEMRRAQAPDFSRGENQGNNSALECLYLHPDAALCRVVKSVLPKPIPTLTDEQWQFIAQRLDKPASPQMQARLKQAIADAKRIKEE